MEQTITTKFNELWDDFVSAFKGGLITESKKKNIDYTIVKLLLSDAKESWTSEYTINGRWLNKIIQEQPQKGLLIKEILTKDINVLEVNSEKSNLDYLKYVLPLGAGGISYSITHAIGMTTIFSTTCATIMPMIIAYPLTQSYLKNRNDKMLENVINDYVSQLNKYKESVISALLS